MTSAQWLELRLHAPDELCAAVDEVRCVECDTIVDPWNVGVPDLYRGEPCVRCAGCMMDRLTQVERDRLGPAIDAALQRALGIDEQLRELLRTPHTAPSFMPLVRELAAAGVGLFRQREACGHRAMSRQGHRFVKFAEGQGLFDRDAP